MRLILRDLCFSSLGTSSFASTVNGVGFSAILNPSTQELSFCNLFLVRVISENIFFGLLSNILEACKISRMNSNKIFMVIEYTVFLLVHSRARRLKEMIFSQYTLLIILVNVSMLW